MERMKELEKVHHDIILIQFTDDRFECREVWSVAGVLCPAGLDDVSKLITWAVDGLQERTEIALV